MHAKWKMVLALAVWAVLLSAIAIAQNKQNKVPQPRSFEIRGDVTQIVDLTDESTVIEDRGKASHAGRFTSQGIGQWGTEGPLSGVGVLTSANGDQLFWESAGSTFTMTGGTGRFEGASGGFTTVPLEVRTSFDSEQNVMIVETSYSGAGTITY